jgi:hypothetical protein
VLIGSVLSSSAPDKFIRPVITFVILASGLKYVGVSTTALGWTLGSILVAAAAGWLVITMRRRVAGAALAAEGAGQATPADLPPPETDGPGKVPQPSRRAR